MIDFISAVNNEEQFEQNLKQSSVFTPTRFALQRGYTNVPRAYNEAAETSTADLLCFVHQDVFFPSYWLNNFWKAVDELERFDANWGSSVLPECEWEGSGNGTETCGIEADNGAAPRDCLPVSRPWMNCCWCGKIMTA